MKENIFIFKSHIKKLMKKPLILLSLMLPVLISTQPVLGEELEPLISPGEMGKLKSFIGEGESATVMCGTDEITGESLHFELDSDAKHIQINCGSDQVLGENVGMNVTLNEGESAKIVCVPPPTSGEVIVPMTLNSTQKVLCSTTSTTN